MKISYNWLKEYLALDLTADETADKLTLAGLEVEDVEHIGSTLDGVIVGKVLTCEKHPNADRLSVCSVDLGGRQVQIVCGAPNVAAGQTVPVATVGTELPIVLDNGESLVLRKAKIRGQVSEGMICAEDELGLSENHEGIMVLDDSLEAGVSFSKVIDIYEDYVFEIGLTPNRPDASCHIGVARDLAAILGKKLTYPSFETGTKKTLDDKIKIEIKDPDKCHRYVAKIIENVTISESPQWLKNKLLAIGLRPVNNVVDATNYVLHELGQPLHAFDYDLVAGKKIIVQSYKEKVKFTTLDDVERSVPERSLFICDGEKPVALAGIMGGLNSEINDKTKTVLLESAYFEPTGIRRTSRLLGLQTDASYRFERGIDPNITLTAAERCARIIKELSGGHIADGTTDVHPVTTEPITLSLRVDFANNVLGTQLEAAKVEKILNGLEITVLENNQGVLKCQVPTFRPDIEREIDLVEEVARIFDYNKIPVPEYVKHITPAPLPFHESLMNKVLDSVKSLGYKEIYTNSLLPEYGPSQIGITEDIIIPTLNPISKDQAIMRPSLSYGFLKAVSYNFNRSIHSVRFFETGHIFQKSESGTYYEGIKEEMHLLMGIAGIKHEEHWSETSDNFTFFDLKGAVDGFFTYMGISDSLSYKTESPDKLVCKLNNTVLGSIRRVDKKTLKIFDIETPTFIAEFSLTELEKVLVSKAEKTFTEIPKFPSFEYDIALVVDKSVSAGDLEENIRKSAGKLLTSVDIFDVYEGKSIGDDKKSIAYRLSFLDKTKTLTISDVEPIIKKVLNKMQKNFSAKLRT